MAINKVVNKSTKTHGAMRNVISYVLQDQKVKDGYVIITGPYPYEEISWDNIYNSFLNEKKLWDKDSGRMYAHNIISFHKDEDISPDVALEIGEEFANKFFPYNQNLIGVHQDKDHLHVHIITNSVSFLDGIKLHQNKKDLEYQKKFTNKLCVERGLSLTEKGKHFDGSKIEEGHITAWSKDKYNLFLHDDKKSFVAECAIAVMESREGCCNKEDFLDRMLEKGWSVTWSDQKKHITFQNENGDKVRDSNISKTFNMDITKEVLLNEFKRQNELRLERNKVAERERYKQQQLDKYYSEVESAIQGNGAPGTTIQGFAEGDRREEQTCIRRSSSRSGENTDSIIREIEADIDINRSKNDFARNTENQSITSERERQAKENKGFVDKTRTGKTSRRNLEFEGPSL